MSWVELMKEWFDDLRFTTIVEGAGHWVQLERATETMQEILRFLAEARPVRG